ncbi:AsmA family protein [uncultured Methylobacterium sp.]|uniref:AsmA family protein n=1 Tax=uncultured Methylobacterium sp. TaxID=157278 RepID=UPI0035CBAB72
MRLRILPIGVIVVAVVAAAAWPALVEWTRGSLERRLAAETGQVWRIGSLAPTLDPAPGLVLGDVSMGGGKESGKGLSATLRRVRIAAPVALLLGGAGTGNAAVEDVTVRLPRTAGADAAMPGGDSGRDRGALRPAAIRVAVKGAQAQPSASDDTLTLTIRTLDLSVDLAPDAPAPALRLDLDAAGAGAVMEADPPGAGGGRPVRLTVNPGSGPRVAATASARLTPTALNLDAIVGSIDRAPFSGSLVLERTAIPRLVAALRLEALALTADGSPAPRVAGTNVLSIAVPPDLVPDVAWFRLFDAQADLSIGRLALGPVGLTGLSLTARVKAGSLDAALVSAAVYEGSARGRYVLGPDAAGAGRHQIGLSLNRIRVRPLLADLAGVQGLDGFGTVRLDLQATGARTGDVVRTAAGAGEFSVVDGRIDGLDLARAAGLLGGAGGGLATRLDLLGGTVSVADGQAVTNDLRLKTGLLDTEGVGSVDLIGRSLDLRLKPLKVVPGSGGRLDVPIRISGPWSNPAVSADLSGLARDPAAAIQGLQDLGGGIFGKQGDGQGGGLGGLLDAIMPSRPGRQRP